MPFQPGESGNPNGTSKLKRFYATLDRVIIQDEQEQTPKLRKAAEKLLEEASKGEPWALQMLADRLDGKPKQQTEITGADGAPLIVQVLKPDAQA